MIKKHELTIREVSKRTGLPTSALRYYEEKGLILSIGRQGITRVFHEKVIEQLALIALARYAGFTLDEIAAMFAPNGMPMIDRQQLLQQAALLEKKIKQLEAMKGGLYHVASCPEENQLDCPKFQALVSKAARAQLLADRKVKH